MNNRKSNPTGWQAEFALPADDAQRLALDFEWPEDGDAFTPSGTDQPFISTHESADPHIWTVQVFTSFDPSDGWISRLKGLLAQCLGRPVPAIVFRPIADKNWVVETQLMNQPIVAGKFVVFQSHARDAADVINRDGGLLGIEVEGGLAFGTGSHETTKGCLEALSLLFDAGFKPVKCMDVGTGTGILAIGAAKLWEIPVMASDNDAVAVHIAAENATLNDVQEFKTCVCAGVDAAAVKAFGPVDLMIANILMQPLIAMAPDLVGQLSAGGHIVLSGILETQVRELKACYQGLGLNAVHELILGDWGTLVLKRTDS